MDENTHNLTQVNSALVNEAIYTTIIDLNKKRKFEDDQLGLPLSKHKFGDRSCISEQEENYVLTRTVKENVVGVVVSDDGSKQMESPTGCISFNSVMSPYPKPNFLKVYTQDQSPRFGKESPTTRIYDQPSTSCGSCGSNSFKGIIHSMDNISNDEGTSIRKDESIIGRQHGTQIPKDGLHFEENELPGFEKYNSEYGTYEIEDYLDMEDNEMKLDSNDAESNLYVLSSERWNVNHDARVDTRKPTTIDQEFEQYFSMLML